MCLTLSYNALRTNMKRPFLPTLDNSTFGQTVDLSVHRSVHRVSSAGTLTMPRQALGGNNSVLPFPPPCQRPPPSRGTAPSRGPSI